MFWSVQKYEINTTNKNEKAQVSRNPLPAVRKIEDPIQVQLNQLVKYLFYFYFYLLYLPILSCLQNIWFFLQEDFIIIILYFSQKSSRSLTQV